MLQVLINNLIYNKKGHLSLRSVAGQIGAPLFSSFWVLWYVLYTSNIFPLGWTMPHSFLFIIYLGLLWLGMAQDQIFYLNLISFIITWVPGVFYLANVSSMGIIRLAALSATLIVYCIGLAANEGYKDLSLF